MDNIVNINKTYLIKKIHKIKLKLVIQTNNNMKKHNFRKLDSLLLKIRKV